MGGVVGLDDATDPPWRAEVLRMRAAHIGSAALAQPGSYVSIHALGDGHRLRGYLVTGRDRPPASEHAITAVAAALLTANTVDLGAAPRDGGAFGSGEGPKLGRAGGTGDAGSSQNPARTAAEDAAILEPLITLRPRTRQTLIASLRTWLAHHGRYDPAAAVLGVHRNTLRYRMARVSEILDVDLADPTVRAHLWLTLGSR